MRTSAALIGIIGLLFVAPAVLADGSYGPELQAALDHLRADGAPLSLAEAAPAPPRPDQNAATLYIPILQANFDPQRPTYPTGPKTGLNRFEIPSGYRPGDWASAESLRPVLASPGCQQALSSLREASLRPQCVFPVRWQDGIYALFPHLAQMRQATRLCSAQAMVEAKSGNIRAAMDWLGVCYRMAGHAAQDPALLGQLVGFSVLADTNKAAQAIVDATSVTPALAAALRGHLDGLEVAARFDRAMLGERGMGLDCFRMIVEGKSDLAEVAELAGSDIAPPDMPKRPAGSMRPYWELEALNYLRYMGVLIERNKQPCRVIAGRVDVDQMLSGEAANLMSEILVPMVVKASRHRDETLAGVDILRTGLALKLVKRGTGSYPATLDALGPTRAKDIFTGRDFIYQRVGQGFKLYSVGVNLRDDHGVGYQRKADDTSSGTDDIVWECAW